MLYVIFLLIGALFKIGLLTVGTHENEASQTATQTLSNQINMTTFRLKFAIRIIKKFMGESPNVLLVILGTIICLILKLGSIQLKLSEGASGDFSANVTI